MTEQAEQAEQPDGAVVVNYVIASEARILKAIGATQVAINDGALNAGSSIDGARIIGTYIKAYTVPEWLSTDMSTAATIRLGQHFIIILAKRPEAGPMAIDLLHTAAMEGKEVV